MQAPQFRIAVPADAMQIASLVNTGYRGEASRKGWTTETDLLEGARTSAAEILSLIAAEDSFLLLCLQDSVLVGCLHIEISSHAENSGDIDKPGRTAHFGMFVVHPDLQSQGLGKLLLANAESLVQTQWGIQHCVMHVITYRHELIAFYQRRGYQPTGELCEFPVNPELWSPKVTGLELAVLEKYL